MLYNRQYITAGGGTMPISHKYQSIYGGETFDVDVKPVGWKGRFPFRKFAYGYSSRVQFNIDVKHGGSKEIPFGWRLSRWDGQNAIWVRSEKDKENKLNGDLIRGVLYPSQKNNVLDLGILFHPGQYSFEMCIGNDLDQRESPQPMVAFSIYDSDIHSFDLAFRIIYGIGGLMLGAIFTLLIQWLT